MNRKSASEILREKYMANQLSKTATEKVHPSLNDLYGIDYCKDEISSKLYNPLFNTEKYREMGARPPKSILIRGIEGVGKSYLVKCFCQHHQIPLLTSFIESAKDVKELFSKSKTVEKSVILIENTDFILSESSIVFQLNESIKNMDWNALVAITNSNAIDKISYYSEIFLKIPTVFGRKEILDGLLKNIKSQNLDTLQISQNLPGFVPRDIVKLISMCVNRAVHRSLAGDVALSVKRQMSIQPSFYSTPDLGRIDDSQASVIMDDFVSCIKDWKSITQSVTFEDIGALSSVKEELTMSILLPSRYPEKFAAFGINKPSGVLLYGPPGCGKTLIAKAVSNMSHCNFLSIKGPELITKYVGDSEKHLRDLFQKAKNLSPCVLFFDEIDSLCGKRGKNEFGNRIVNQILTLLDGMEDRGEVYLIGATNRIDSLDDALMRPGRFDKIVEVPLPTQEESQEIFRKCILKVPHENFDFNILDFTNFSGADIAGIVKESATLCLKENFDSSDLKIGSSYFINAIDKMKEMKARSKKSSRSKRSSG